jgi:hypothetical protein
MDGDPQVFLRIFYLTADAHKSLDRLQNRRKM